MTSLDIVRLAAFTGGTLGLLLISRRSLFRIGSHGFYRFFAWESILGIVVLNLPFWFSDPFSPRQLISWFLLLSSLAVLWMGVSRLRSARHSADRREGGLYAFEKTSELVTAGIYRYIRHPLYASLLYLAWGAALKQVMWEVALLTLSATLFLTLTAKADEKECIGYFGMQYEEYMKRTRRFVPFLF